MTTTLFEKVWQRNLVRAEAPDSPAILHVGLHLIHEVTSPQAFTVLRERGLRVRRPDLTLATIDHSVPTLPAGPDGRLPYVTAQAERQVETLRANTAEHGIELLDLGDERRGIVHLVGPELGRTQPGQVIVCGDSHTSTHGAFGALAFGIGTTEVGHVLATQCLFQRRPLTMRVHFEGAAPPGITAKDMALAAIARLGMDGGTGYVLEYTGEAVRALSMEGRMTLWNLSIEAGARAGMVAPDEVTFDYLRGRPGAPADWDAAVAGLASTVRTPSPWRPRKLRFDVLTTTSPGAPLSPFIAMHMEQPGSRHCAPAAVKTASSPSASACRFTASDPGTISAVTPSATRRPRKTAAAARRSSIRPLVQLPTKTRATGTVPSAWPAVSPM